MLCGETAGVRQAFSVVYVLPCLDNFIELEKWGKTYVPSECRQTCCREYYRRPIQALCILLLLLLLLLLLFLLLPLLLLLLLLLFLLPLLTG